MSELKACPFCGSAARSDNGFIPIEGVEYVWCTNQACKLSDVDIDFTPEIWNRRAPDREQMRFTLIQSGWGKTVDGREAFESAWKKLNGAGPDYVIGRNSDDTYLSEETEFNWQLWQAALASIPQPPFTDLDAAVETIASEWERKQS